MTLFILCGAAKLPGIHANFNVSCFDCCRAISIGLSEVQRRQLGQQSTEVTLELRKVEQQRLAQREIELDRTYKLINEINNRMSNVEGQMEALNAKAQVLNIAK